MYLLISLVIVIIFTLIFSQSIVKYKQNYILGSVMVGLLLNIFPIINQRYVGLSLMVIVMYSGVINNNKDYARKLKTSRATLAMMSVVLISFHALKHIIQLNIKIDGIIAYSLLIPLFLTSFKIIKSKMGHTKWKFLHKLAYMAYVFIFLHLMIQSDMMDQIIYGIIFGGYVILRIFHIFRHKNEPITM